MLVRRLVLLTALFSLAACSRVAPCEPWKGWALTALSDAPGERIDACGPGELRWRVMPGGEASRWLDRLEHMTPEGGWRLWRRRALVRPGAPAVSVSVQEQGDDLVITLRPDRSVDVAKALAELAHEP